MSQPDFHQILGITPSASAAEIKRAFKRMAMRWHPDRNADPQAHEQFRLAREAFEHLTGARETLPAEEPPASPPVPRGEDHHLEVTVQLGETALGSTVTLTVPGREPCNRCDGSGQRSYGRTSMCSACHGSGRIRSPASDTLPSYPNGTRYISPGFDENLRKGVATIDALARMAHYAKAEQIGMNDAPLMPLFYEMHYQLLQPNVRGRWLDAMARMDLKFVWKEQGNTAQKEE